MDLLPAAGFALGAGYLLGSIPFTWLLVRARKGIDLRTVGSGNVGATNASRVLGAGWFPLLFVLDFGKGLAPVLLAAPLLAPAAADEGWVRTAAGLGAVLGHALPFALGFRGGKGVATGAGVVCGMAPLSSVVALAAFLATTGVSRYVSLGSVAGAIAVCASYPALSRGVPQEQRLPVGAFLLVLLAFVFVKHLPNLRRIAAGTEPRIFAGPAAPAGQDPPRADQE
jgi:glycerol-3-phosphate acyltransferase PlsY